MQFENAKKNWNPIQRHEVRNAKGNGNWLSCKFKMEMEVEVESTAERDKRHATRRVWNAEIINSLFQNLSHF